MIALGQTLLTGYGAAAALAFAWRLAGGTLGVAFLILWLGGALAVLALAARRARASWRMENEIDASVEAWREDDDAERSAAAHRAASERVAG